MYILYTNSSYIICTSKTWSSNIDFYSNSNYHPPVYDSVHLERKASKKGCGVLIYIKKHNANCLIILLFQIFIRSVF